ncbi:MAG: hypothetical protein KBA26_01095 [Candidatus Delongbacteria bacterium]|nr:hypothetical protein [Candidatus Delongbacteria bacterium]
MEATSVSATRWRVILPLIYIFLIISSFGIYFHYRQTTIQGINTVLLDQTPELQQKLVDFLTAYKDQSSLKLSYYYMELPLIENRPIRKLVAEVNCRGNDPYLLSFNLVTWIDQHHLRVLESHDEHRKIRWRIGYEKTEIIQLTINK